MDKKISIPYGHSPELHKFIQDEVTRQGHDITNLMDGGIRVNWMHNAWQYAMENRHRSPDLNDVIRIGHLMEPEYNHPSRFRTINVFVGTHEPPRHQDVPGHMASLMASIPFVHNCNDRCSGDNTQTDYYRTSGRGHSHPNPDDWYLEFERIHPFCDGNGRTGKVVRSWLRGDLDSPHLVQDYFGGGNP